ncbi:MAG: hypothetical protein OSA97_15975, partial [Nevskia sp.]|nr:hypothetical protein [Nevskia sp.]
MRFTKGVAVLAMMGTALIAGAQSTWTFNSLHDFDRTSARAEGGVILAPDGNYYGTFSQGGANGNGGIFKVAIDPATGNSSYSVVYSFSALAGNGANADGAASAQSPAGSLALSADFTQLYGTTTAGGAFGLGTLFSLTLPTLANPSPSFGTLASFGASSAAQGFVTAQPALQIVVGPDGTVYGTSPGGEIWKYDGSPSVLYTLSMGTGPRVNHDGELPQGLVYGPDGKLWGVCASGGANASGTVFNLTTTGQFSLVYTYSSGPYQSNQTNSDGANPIGLSALPDGSGFYVVTTQGGANGSGAIGKATVAGVFTALGSLPAAGDAGGSTPTAAPLVASDGTILQTFSAGGANGTGAVSTVTLPPVAAAVAFPAGAGTLATVTLSPVFTFLALSSDGSNSSGAIPVGPTM